MGTQTTFANSYTFIELHRTFHELPKHSSANDEVDISQTLGIGARLTWDNLINEYRIIVLSEAGSGKTSEVRNVTKKLHEQGKPAFFLRLEHIPNDFEDAFEVGTFEAFEKWLASGEEGWLLLDSVDEARLRSPRDFEKAIIKLNSRISTAKDRTHIVITGRTNAWRPRTDLINCTKYLSYATAATSESDHQTEDDDPSGSLLTETINQGDVKSVFKIVTLDDLSVAQIAAFTKEKGLEDSQAFLDAVERADAWSFTSRPQDLEELIEFWIDKSRIGSRLEIMRNSIDRRLIERDQDRADACPLSADRTRQGAVLLAAATTLTREPTIRVPDGVEDFKGVAVQTVLPDWDDKDLSTLLSRPIFDEAIYGTIRFHQRSTREYLAAEWFAKLLNLEVSRRSIEGLFFCNQYGIDIVVPSLRPILPWLAILDDKIRARVCKIAPEIIFEGGDPSQLPLEIRRNILHQVCEQMDQRPDMRSAQDYAAVQRFANPDLADEVRALLNKYTNNEDLKAFLLRMVWIGELTEALPETMDVALNPSAEQYTRIAAFRAVQAIASHEDQERVRQSFVGEKPEIKREWLVELIKGLQSTEQTLTWLLACLKKSEPKEQFTVDYLTDGVTEFVVSLDIELLPQLVTGLNKLLDQGPVIERRFCKVSEKFQWLMVPACKAVELLILDRHPTSLETDALAILHKFSAVRDYGGNNDLNDVKTELSALVPSWKELNKALFWFEVQRSRGSLDKNRGERIINYWQTSIFGSFWRFDKGDFEDVMKEVSRRTFLDDRLVALSLAFDLYKAAERPRKWRESLKKLVAGNNELSERLGSYLRPSAQNQEERDRKKKQVKWKRQEKARQEKEKKNLADWKRYLNEKHEENYAILRDKPGIISNSLHYLFRQARDKKHSSSKWTEYNWKTLIPEFGENVARYYRDGAVSFWRHHEPKLRSEGAPANKATLAVIIGLTGLEIEAHETKGWPKNLSDKEAELACKYASFELNGFPTWFPKLFEIHKKIVGDFLIQEIRYELSIENPGKDTHHVINDLSCSGQWAWNHLAPRIYDLLKREPKNLSNLDNLLKIIQGSSISGDHIEKIAFRKCRTLQNLMHVARWFAVWTDVAPEVAIAALKKRIGKIAAKDRTSFVMIFATQLLGGCRGDALSFRHAFKTPEHLKSLYLMMHDYIRREEDIVRTGVYSPGLRDEAQYARDNLFSLLNQIPGKESFLALLDISEVHPEEASRPWMKLHAIKKAEQDGDIKPWSPAQVRDFHEKLERTPANHKELAELAIQRFLDLKDDLEHGDSSVASILKRVTLETEMRNYIGQWMRDKAFRRYISPQEEELADAKKPDLRFHGIGFDGPVPIELKLADNWGGPKLFERLENQLCGDYLRDNRSKRGIFVLVYRGKANRWELPSGERVDFAGLTTALQDLWRIIAPKFPEVDDVTVIGIDLTKRTS